MTRMSQAIRQLLAAKRIAVAGVSHDTPTPDTHI